MNRRSKEKGFIEKGLDDGKNLAKESIKEIPISPENAVLKSGKNVVDSVRRMKGSVDSLIDKQVRNTEWTNFLHGSNYQEMLKGSKLEEMFINMPEENFENNFNDFKYFLEKRGQKDINRLLSDPEKIENVTNIFNSEHYDSKMKDLVQYGIKDKEKFDQFYKENPKFFTPSLSGLPSGESWETIEAKLTEEGFERDEKDRIMNFIGDFRFYKYDSPEVEGEEELNNKEVTDNKKPEYIIPPNSPKTPERPGYYPNPNYNKDKPVE